MRLVIDSNEYIFAFGSEKVDASLKLLEKLVETSDAHIVRIPRTMEASNISAWFEIK